MTAIQTLSYQGPPEDFAALDLEHGCGDPPTAQPGTAAWRQFLLSEVGGRDLGIVRACDTGGASEHKTGRAFDWGNNASDPAEKARADELLADLLAPDDAGNQAAVFRRLGLMYVIWNGQIWSVSTKSWRPYTGQSPHTDHVHFSFGWPGALGTTSFFQALGVPAVPVPVASQAPSVVLGAGLVAGAVVGWFGWHWMSKRI